MRSTLLVLILLASVAFSGSAFAVSSGKTADFPDGSAGKVIFDGKVHADKGLKCSDCHPKIFQMKRVAKMTMADINAGKYCGTCHTGEKAFKSSDPANCSKCHKK